jgi:hypothetical protein
MCVNIRDRILNEFNSSTLDAVGPIGEDQGMNVLKEMNNLEADHEAIVKSLAPNLNFL